MTVESQQSCHFRNAHISILQITQCHLRRLLRISSVGESSDIAFDFTVEIGAADANLVTKASLYPDSDQIYSSIISYSFCERRSSAEVVLYTYHFGREAFAIQFL